ncbi:MAG TPA: fumarylacetoacetate hydrolase family protein [bacterium]|nr:fumarylacetoacetate hydrolase family protein [bacterium]
MPPAVDSAAIAERLLSAWEAGADQPADLAGMLDIDAAYAVQMAVLARHRAAGRTQSGWKIGQTSAAMRAANGETTAALGFVLAAGGLENGARLALEGAENRFLEPELAFVMGRDLRGADVTPEQVRAAVSHVAPAFELVTRHGRFADRALQRALNLAHGGYVLGERTTGCPDATALDALHVTVTCNGAKEVEARGGEVNDNPLASTAWLAQRLAPLGEGLSAGQVILTGSYSPLLPLRPGQRWVAAFGGLGQVALQVD